MLKISKIGINPEKWFRRILPPNAKFVLLSPAGGPGGFFSPLFLMQNSTPTSGKGTTNEIDGIKENLISVYRNRGYHENELEIIRKALTLQSSLGIDLTSQAQAIELLISWKVSPHALAAFLLKPASLEAYADQIEPQVTELVKKWEMLNLFPYCSDPQAKTGSKFLKFLILWEENPEVLLLKTAELFQNLTQNAGGIHPQAPLALEVFAPFLKILGFSQSAQQLEDLAFLNSKPEEFNLTESQTFSAWQGGKTFLLEELKTLVGILSNELSKGNIPFQISWRIKGFLSIYNKNRKVNDLLGIRIVVRDKEACYEMQSILNTIMNDWGFKRIDELCDDYIARPKKSGYQALHEVFKEEKNDWQIEIQIKSKEMHQEAEVGSYSHLKYKLANEGFSDLELNGESSQERYYNNRDNLKKQRVIFAFDADGKIHKIGPIAQNSQKPTVLDFAFHLSRDFGIRCLGATIFRLDPKKSAWQEIRASFDTPIENGDMVRLNLDNEPLPASEKRQRSVTTYLGIASLELLKQGRTIDLKRRYDELHEEGVKIFEKGIEILRREFIARFNQACPVQNLEKRFLFSIERIYKKLGFDELGVFYTALGLKRGKSESFMAEVNKIIRDSSLVVGYPAQATKEKEITFYYLVKNLPGVLARLLELTKSLPTKIKSISIRKTKEEGLGLITLKIYSEKDFLAKYLRKLEDLYKHVPLVSILPLQRKVRIEGKIKEEDLTEFLEIILGRNGDIVSGEAHPTFLSSKMSLGFEVNFPMHTFEQELRKINKIANLKKIKIKYQK